MQFALKKIDIDETVQTPPQSLDGFPNQPIIGRNYIPMNMLLSLSLIAILIVVLIIKGLFSVRMATVRVK